MRSLAELARFARAARDIVAREGDAEQFEVYCTSGDKRIARLNYTSDIPCRGLEEMKSLEADGFHIRITRRGNPHEIGAAFEAGELSAEAVRAVLTRARRAAVIDPDFPGFPSGPRSLRSTGQTAGDLIRAGDGAIAAAAWSVVEGAAATFARRNVALDAATGNSRPRLVVGGDVTVVRDRIALASSNFSDVRTDASAYFSSSVTALVESLDGKGTASAVGSSVSAMKRATATLGVDAVNRALSLAHGVRPEAGVYRVVLGPQPIAEILNYMVMGSLTTGAFHRANSAYQGRFGARVMDERLGLIDDPRKRDGAIGRRVTCEGFPTRRIELVREGRLVGLMSNFYDSNRLEHDSDRATKLGPDADGVGPFPALSGYRLGEGGGREYNHYPASSGTNVVMTAREGVADEELIRAVGDGLYVGRVWYTYPINGQRAGDFTCTVSGDSRVIRNGKLAEPIAPNSLRINSNIERVFNRVMQAGRRSHPAVVWGAAQVYYVPALAVDGIELAAVGERLGQT